MITIWYPNWDIVTPWYPSYSFIRVKNTMDNKPSRHSVDPHPHPPRASPWHLQLQCCPVHPQPVASWWNSSPSALAWPGWRRLRFGKWVAPPVLICFGFEPLTLKNKSISSYWMRKWGLENGGKSQPKSRMEWSWTIKGMGWPKKIMKNLGRHGGNAMEKLGGFFSIKTSPETFLMGIFQHQKTTCELESTMFNV